MQNDTLLALLLDPFLTFEEAAKEVGAIPSPARESRPARLNGTASRGPAGASRRPARIKGRGVPVIHHQPATAG